MQTNAHFLGVVTGVFLAACQMVWVTLVALGWAQPLADFVFAAWFFEPFLKVQQFDLTHGLVLIGVVGLVGYAIGRGVGVVWNRTSIG